VLAAFHDVNDPYVLERLTAAARGVVLRAYEAEGIKSVASGVREMIGDRLPEHLLVRDFVRRVFVAAREVGWDGPIPDPPYGADWPVGTRSFEEIEALCARRHTPTDPSGTR
jgi:hypothetical protein